jgi:dihydrofolate reductase
MGSGELVQSLMRHGLVDEYALLIHPLVLGAGRRLSPAGEFQGYDKGVVVAACWPGVFVKGSSSSVKSQKIALPAEAR